MYMVINDLCTCYPYWYKGHQALLTCSTGAGLSVRGGFGGGGSGLRATLGMMESRRTGTMGGRSSTGGVVRGGVSGMRDRQSERGK